MAAAQDRFEYGGARRYEEFEADFEPGAGVFEPIEEIGRGGGGRHVEGDDEALPGALARVFRAGLYRLRAWHTRTVGDWVGVVRRDGGSRRHGWLRVLLSRVPMKCQGPGNPHFCESK